MAFLTQFQRRAIESLKPHASSSLSDILSSSFWLNGKQSLIILGISEGIGSCSDIHGMNVLVLSANFLNEPLRIPTAQQIRSCAYAVIIREAREDESVNHNFDPSAEVNCVELLKVLYSETSKTEVSLTGHRAYYVALV